MKYSTANGWAFLFFAIGAVPISTYFYLDANDMMIPFSIVILKPVMVIAVFTAFFILLASIMASTRKQKRINETQLQKSIRDTYMFNHV